MKCVFVSNYLTHHQIPFCDELYRQTNGDFRFICYETMSEERKSLNWEVEKAEYEVRAYESVELYDLAKEWLHNADVAIISGEPNNFIDIKKRLKEGKLTFRFSERIFKKKYDIKNILRSVKHFVKNFGYKNLYLLSASAYASFDYAKIGLFKNKSFKWGYFPDTKKYDDIDFLVAKKEKASILWVARFIDLKHPETPVLVAEKLRDAGYGFKLNMIGSGILEEEILKLIEQKGLSEYVNILGSMTPDEVRKYMEQSEIFLFTSDRGEGWGAVLNEAMNSGCVPIASHAIGSAPFLIEDGVNSFLYKDGDIDNLFNKIKYLLENNDRCNEMGKSAYRTITEQWSAQNAAARFLKLCNCLLNGQNVDYLFKDGVLSKAEKLRDNWYK